MGASVSISTTRGVMQGTYTIKSFCSPDLEFHMLLCRPFWLPREFTAIIITAVYIPPQANTDQALKELYGNISEQETAHPDAAFIVTGDFNKANFRTIAPKNFQHAWSLCTGPLQLSLPGRLQIPPPSTFRQIGSLFHSTPACLQAETETRSTRPQDNPIVVGAIGRYTTGLF